jgi:hypothetical protein
LNSAGDFREFSPKKFEKGATGGFQQLEKPAFGGPFCCQRRKFSETRNAWLTSQDSNFDIPFQKKAPLKCQRNFRQFGAKFGLETFASSSCGLNMEVVGLTPALAEGELASFVAITDYPSRKDVQFRC